MPLTSKDLSVRLSRRLANYKVKDATIKALVDRVMVEGLAITRFDICSVGICFDYWTTKPPKLDGFYSRTDLSRLEVFPYGIIDWDYFHVRAGFNVDELPGGGNVGPGF